MQIAATLAAQSYAANRSATTPSGADGGSFFTSAAADFAATLRAGEETAIASMQGQGDPHTLVTALTQAELAVETAVTLRNRVVEAYQEILRMPV
jgi:flagellar hook-basal body complex protein FliE